MKVRHLAEQMQALARRGYGDDHVQIEVDGVRGRVNVLRADAWGGVVLTTADDAEDGPE